MAQKTTAKKPMNEDPRFAQAVQNYEAGLRALQERKFEKAKGLLQKAVTGSSKELADRLAVHINTCNQHMERSANQFKGPEEHYDFAVSLMNVGDYVTAREHLEKLSKQVPIWTRRFGSMPHFAFRRATTRISRTWLKIPALPSYCIPTQGLSWRSSPRSQRSLRTMARRGCP